MISIKKPNVNDAPWKILLSALFLSLLGLIALNSISYQSTSLAMNPFYKQLLFLFLAIIGFVFSFLTPKYIIHKYAYFIYGLGSLLVILPFLGTPMLVPTGGWTLVCHLIFSLVSLLKFFWLLLWQDICQITV